ncbi:microtubule-associated protein 6 homolog [Cololabis saira]|uniref:microtubule-associated protein 6 homolog n=1 Tax=Cololabis saira TaxID=129043 RepID=UPI002AD50FFA|nr:microtubule-associated protein 6 homolog [Cololabis saira]
MAWPCISRVCCLARFWNQFDKSDLSVPLTVHSYSDVSEPELRDLRDLREQRELRSVTKQVSDSERRGSPRDGPPATRGSSRSYKPREDYRPPGVPFPSVTQYKQDFKPWPIPRKETFPWISNGGSSSSRADSVSDSPGNKSRRCGEQQVMMEDSRTSSYRQEYRPWTGAKPAKSAKRNPQAQYSSPGTDATRIPRETSYQAAYSGEISRATSVHQGEHIFPSAASTVQPPPVAQLAITAPQVGSSPSPSSLQQSVLPNGTEPIGAAKTEEHLVRTKLPPNPSAVFQSGSRVFNI